MFAFRSPTIAPLCRIVKGWGDRLCPSRRPFELTECVARALNGEMCELVQCGGRGRASASGAVRLHEGTNNQALSFQAYHAA
jgi:hypothetical protein